MKDHSASPCSLAEPRRKKTNNTREMEEVQRDTTEILRVLAPLPRALSLTQGTGSSARKKDWAVWDVSNDIG
jgi:hypothetical protein